MHKTKLLRRALALLMMVVLLMATGAPALAASFKAKINSSSAKVYSLPSTSRGVSVKAVRGTTVKVTAYAKGWARISYKGHTGYIPVKYLNLTNRIKAYTAKSTPVYKSASSSSSKLGTLSIGKAVYVVGVSGDYYRVQNSSGSVTGYVKSGNLTTKAKLTEAYNKWKQEQESSSSNGGGSGSNGGGSSNGGSSSTSDKLSKVISLAKSLIGRGYAINDNPPSTFNCSSFVEYCMEKYGFSMQGTAVKQASDGRYAKISSMSDIKAGDVLCFDTNNDGVCDHTAICTGKGSFIEASENAGVVQTNSMTDWYKDHFMHARRPS